MDFRVHIGFTIICSLGPTREMRVPLLTLAARPTPLHIQSSPADRELWRGLRKPCSTRRWPATSDEIAAEPLLRLSPPPCAAAGPRQHRTRKPWVWTLSFITDVWCPTSHPAALHRNPKRSYRPARRHPVAPRPIRRHPVAPRPIPEASRSRPGTDLIKVQDGRVRPDTLGGKGREPQTCEDAMQSANVIDRRVSHGVTSRAPERVNCGGSGSQKGGCRGGKALRCCCSWQLAASIDCSLAHQGWKGEGGRGQSYRNHSGAKALRWV